MSLINSMLRDLEARRSDGAAAAPFQGQVRAVPVRTAPMRKFRLGAVAGGVVLLAVAAVAGQRLWQAPATAPAPTAATAPQVALKVPEATPPAAVDAPATLATPATTAAPLAPVAQAVQQEPAAAKPAAAVDAPAVKAREASNVTVKATPAVEGSPAAMQAQAKAAAPAPSPAAATSIAAAASAKPAAQPTPAIPAAPALQTASTSAGSQPVVAPAKRQPVPPIAAPQSQPRNDEAPLQPAVAPASPAAEPLKIVRESMPQPDMAMQQARQQLQDNALREAIDTLQRTLPQAGSRADYHAFLAALLQRDDQHRAAAEHYAIALRSAPDNGVWWMGLGISYQALQMPTQAQQAYRSAQASRTLSPELAAFVDARLGQLQRP